MAFSIQDFRQPLKGEKQDLIFSSPAYFEVQFMDLPASFSKFSRVNSLQYNLAIDMFTNLRFRCFSTDLPARQTVGLSRQLNGPARIIPYAANYTTTMLDFIETPLFNIRAFFDIWMDLIEGKHTGYMCEYYDDLIISEVRITSYTKSGDPVGLWKFKNVLLMAINTSTLNWEAQSQHVNVPVEIGYSDWTFEPVIAYPRTK